MPSMTMPFSVRDSKQIAGMRSGDAISFRLTVTDDDSWIDQIKKIKADEVRLPARVAPPKPRSTSDDSTRLREGDMMPAFELTDQNGERITLETFRGRPFVLTFIFTRCPIPNFCPLMSKNFSELQKAIKNGSGTLAQTRPASFIGYGLIGFLFVILWVPAGVGPASAVLILAPLFVARWAFVQYGDEQRARERTLSALVAAVETKDLYTRGHSERVASLCDLMAGSLALSHQETEALRFAGILHDIGKLAIPTRVLRKADRLSGADLDRIASHVASGVEMVQDIEFLSDSTDAILHHHERMDGLGYPAGLRGEDTPLLARIIAVADAFDSLTTSRFHREAYTVERALAELNKRAGTQFDPSIVAALERGLVRHPWEPTRLEPTLMATAGRAFDHDDPAASDLMAGLARSEQAT